MQCKVDGEKECCPFSVYMEEFGLRRAEVGRGAKEEATVTSNARKKTKKSSRHWMLKQSPSEQFQKWTAINKLNDQILRMFSISCASLRK